MNEQRTSGRRAWIFTCCTVAVAAVFGAAARGEPPRPPGATVKLVVDYGDGVQKHFTQLSWKEGMTVADALSAAAKHPRGIRIVTRGRGATAFLSQIDEVKNQPGGRNWLYRVNGKLADRSFGIYGLDAADTVLWTFEEYQ